MNGQAYTFLGLECTNNGSYFQIRLHKTHLARIGRGFREFLLVSCTLLSISLLALVTIVWVVTALADIDKNAASYEPPRFTASLPQLSPMEQHWLSREDFYALNEVQYDEQIAYTDAR